MKSKKSIMIMVAVIVVVASALLYVYLSSPYTEYASAFSKTTKLGSMEYDTKVVLTVDGEKTVSKGNMKIRDIDTNVNFINVMEIDGNTITQFTDGDYLYNDDGQTKRKFKLGAKMDSKPKGDFDMSYYVQEFAELLDASKIKDIKIAEKLNQNIVKKITKKSISSGAEYELILAEQVVNDIFESVINEQLNIDVKPECELNSFKYTSTVNKQKYIDSITYSIDMDVTFPKELTNEDKDSTKNIQIVMTLEFVNPGTAADFKLPSTDGYQ